MMRLLVEARTAEWTSGGDVPLELLVGVSVSRPDDGSPVTGLGVGNFRVAAQFGDLSDFAVDEVREWLWEPGDVEPAGADDRRRDQHGYLGLYRVPAAPHAVASEPARPSSRRRSTSSTTLTAQTMIVAQT